MIPIVSLVLIFFGVGSATGTFFTDRRNIFASAGGALAAGILISFTLLLFFQDFSILQPIVLGLALVGYARWFQSKMGVFVAFKETIRTHPALMGSSLIAIVILVTAVFLLLSTSPIDGWDPTAIWFQAGKMIYTAKSVGIAAGWTSSEIPQIHHFDYPKLLPFLAAVTAESFGTWDEFTPKLGFFFLFLPAILLLFSFRRENNGAFWLLPISFIAVMRTSIADGMIDGYLTFYAGLAILFLERLRTNINSPDFGNFLICSGITLCLKSEGAIIVACIWITAMTLKPFRQRAWTIRGSLSLLLPWIPFIQWTSMRHRWEIFSEYSLSSHRMSDLESIFTIINALLLKHHDIKWGLAVSLFTAIVLRKLIPLWRNRVPVSSLFFLAYGFCLFIVYFSTPHDLDWQINTSIERTTKPLVLTLYLTIYFMVDSFDKNVENDHANNHKSIQSNFFSLGMEIKP